MIHQAAHGVLGSHERAQPRLRQRSVADHAAAQSATHAAKHQALDDEAFVCHRFEQDGVHDRPQKAMPAQATDELAGVIPQQVLGPLCRSNFSPALFPQVPDAHRELQRERLREAARRPHTGRSPVDGRPPIQQLPR